MRMRVNPGAAKKWGWLCAAAVLLAGPLAGQSDNPKSARWSGIIVYSSCNADEAFNESLECFKNAPGAKLALYDDTSRVMYSVEPQELAAGHLGEVVSVYGALNEDTIHVTRLEPLSMGLAVGQKAPEFAMHDQFGQTQTLESLRGRKGTVLLFFRSADW